MHLPGCDRIAWGVLKGGNMELTRTILVTGATGRQGGAVVRHLLKNGWRVRALTRDLNKPASRDLALQGVEVCQGNLEEHESVREAIEGCYGVFSVQNFWECGMEGEIRQGKLLGDLAKEADIQHFIYSSVGSADKQTGIPHFDSKFQIEQHLSSLNLTLTILRPVFFFDNFNGPDLRSSILSGTLAMPMKPDKPLQMIAVEDIGGFATLAFNRPDQFIGKALDIAGDELTMTAVAESFSSVLHRPVRYVELSIGDTEKVSPESAVMFRWFNQHGYTANPDMLREIYPQLMSLANWLRASGWESLPREKVA